MIVSILVVRASVGDHEGAWMVALNKDGPPDGEPGEPSFVRRHVRQRVKTAYSSLSIS